MASLGPGFASGINAVYGHVGPGRWRLSAAPPGWLGYTLAQTLANAGWPYAMLIGTLDTQPDRTALPRLRDLLHFARRHEDDYRDLQSVAPIGLLWSERTATAGPGWDDPAQTYVPHFRGWYDRLTRRQRLFDLLSDAQLEGPPGQLHGPRPAPALRPPDRPPPGPPLRRRRGRAGRVRRPGRAPGGHGRAPSRRPARRAVGAAGVLAERSRVSNSYFRLRPETPTAPPPRRRRTLPSSRRGSTCCRWRGGCGTSPCARGPCPGWASIPPEDYGAPEQTTFEIATGHPGAIWYADGRGASCYLPWEPDRAWYETGSEALGRLLDLVVEGSLGLGGVEGGGRGDEQRAGPARAAAGAPPAAVEAPGAPEAVELHGAPPAGQRAPPGAPGQRVGGHPPPGGRSRCRCTTSSSASASPALRGPCPWCAPRAWREPAPRLPPGGFEVTLPRLDLFELIAVEPPPG